MHLVWCNGHREVAPEKLANERKWWCDSCRDSKYWYNEVETELMDTLLQFATYEEALKFVCNAGCQGCGDVLGGLIEDGDFIDEEYLYLIRRQG